MTIVYLIVKFECNGDESTLSGSREPTNEKRARSRDPLANFSSEGFFKNSPFSSRNQQLKCN